MTGSNLYSPLKVGNMQLQHRVAMAPLTRLRSPKHTPNALVEEYYEQRASVPGTLLITEATFIRPEAGGLSPNVPGIWNDEQIEAWRKVFDRIHAQGSYVYVQLWALGRQANPTELQRTGHDYVSASDIKMEGSDVAPRPLSIPEIKEYVQWYVTAAKNAIKAGADGVEVHGANGYLPDQFLHECSNTRTDEYGGSLENRARFILEITDAVVEAVGADRVGVRLSPWNDFGSLNFGVSPVPQWAHVTAEFEKRAQAGKRLAYLHFVEPRVSGHEFADRPGDNSFVRSCWHGVVLTAGGLTDIAEERASSDSQTVVVIGRNFISNPDLPRRLQNKWPITKYDRSTFYSDGAKGYTDYSFYSGK